MKRYICYKSTSAQNILKTTKSLTETGGAVKISPPTNMTVEARGNIIEVFKAVYPNDQNNVLIKIKWIATDI